MPNTNSHNLIGKRFGMLVVIRKTELRGGNSVIWECDCDCGKKGKLVRSEYLRKGGTKSCGCSTGEFCRKSKTTHGLSRKAETRPTFIKWVSMLSRCKNKKDKSFKYYGGRGITVCDRWLDFALFFSDMGAAPIGMTIERVDNDKGYSPENCRWATIREQANNKRSNRIISAVGLKMTISNWAETVGIPKDTIRTRLEAGWSEYDSLFTPVKKRKNNRINRERNK